MPSKCLETFNRKVRNAGLITGIIPCFNGSKTLREVIQSLANQDEILHEILVIDDGSVDETSAIAKEMNCRVITLEGNYGRGHSRNIGISECKTPFALFCDCTNVLPSNFATIGLSHFVDNSVAAVFGRINNHHSMKNAYSRWRGRHLFREHMEYRKDIHEVKCLISYATIFRRSAILDAGNFDRSLRKCEDQDIGEKLLRRSYKIISDPDLITYSIRRETMSSVCIRFNRWFSDHKKEFNCRETFLHTLRTSITIFLREDLKNRDIPSMLISFLLPFWMLALGVFSRKKLID